jgi:non-heme Fe2+,alpha-ketoglutarate-dependent halogenase
MTTPTLSSSALTPEQQQGFQENGYHFPIGVLSPAEVAEYRNKFLAYREANQTRLQGKSGNQLVQNFSEMHFVARWVYDIVRNERVLDAVSSVLGPNLIAWGSTWFAKMPGEKTFVSWHQDGMYWNLEPDAILTAWIALSPSVAANGCLRVIPGTHKRPAIPHQETHNPDNALSRGQDIAAEVDESQAVDIELNPGEMSLHHLWIAHGSRPNLSPDTPRIGLAVRYVSTEVRQHSPQPPLGLLVRGKDDYGHFELLPPPVRDDIPPGDREHLAIIERIRSSVMAKFC